MQENTKENRKKNEYAHVLKYTGIFGGVQGLNLIASILRNKFAALLLGPSGLGLVSILFVSVCFLLPIYRRGRQ